MAYYPDPSRDTRFDRDWEAECDKADFDRKAAREDAITHPAVDYPWTAFDQADADFFNGRITRAEFDARLAAIFAAERAVTAKATQAAFGVAA